MTTIDGCFKKVETRPRRAMELIIYGIQKEIFGFHKKIVVLAHEFTNEAFKFKHTLPLESPTLIQGTLLKPTGRPVSFNASVTESRVDNNGRFFEIIAKFDRPLATSA